MSVSPRRTTARTILSLAVTVAATTVLAGCVVIPLGPGAPVAPAPSPSSSPSSPAPPNRGERILDGYLETARSTVPLILAELGGVIADIIIDGSFHEGADGSPDVTTVSFRYVLSRVFDSRSSTDSFDSDFERACPAVFRDMRAFGVEGQIDLTYLVEDLTGEIWEFPCDPDDGITHRPSDQ